MPIYAFIKRELKNQIESGELPEGSRVPSEFELAKTYGVSRNPTRQALRDLELEGYLIRSPGRGSFVAPVTQRQKLFKSNGWRSVAIACPDLEVHYTRTVIQSFIQCAAERGFHTMVYFLRFSGEAEVEFLADLRNGGVEGIAFWLQHVSERTLDLLRKFQRASFPFVLIDRYVRELETDYVITDNEDVAYQLTQRLLQKGHTTVGYLTTELDNTTSEDRYGGHCRALREAGITPSAGLVGIFDRPDCSNLSVVSGLMAHRTRPTAFVCNNDGIAATLLDELANLGFQVPGDVEVATVDDNCLADAVDMPLLTAAQQGDEMGRESAEMLLRRIEHPALAPMKRLLRAVLV